VALANPFDADVTLAPGLFGLPALRGTITDTHFRGRDRMGRLLAFMARIAAGGSSGRVRGIGVDEQTALLVDENGAGSVIGSGAVYVLDASAPAARCAPNEPLLFEGVAVRRLRAGDSVNLAAGTGGGQSYRVTAKLGAVDSTTGEVY
jgi:cyanophycinase